LKVERTDVNDVKGLNVLRWFVLATPLQLKVTPCDGPAVVAAAGFAASIASRLESVMA
jgi:hypothetical protein